ncbi:MAG: 2-amino-4-hydroxy-6-hydroxymethyldihydropteridine diphosphokinase [Desulfobacteraceae bacterium]|nr:2-amino-4-hydroxy-6-hydroxymethyldihydropteridine diphosphokinase [Desulfobacteraceae bacterium]
MRKTAYIGIGSNLGDTLNNCDNAIDLINGISGCGVVARSDFFRTEPVGVEAQDWYVNGVISLTTDLSVKELLNNLLAIESGMGRKREKKWDSRIIDLDILLFGEEVIEEKDLRVPHPHMHMRRFVLVPMVQLAPDLIHPVLGITMAELLNNSSLQGQAVTPIKGE